jgi:uncharacterized repeat protein (TIGR04138 family)
MASDFEQKLEIVLNKDRRYKRDAYEFLMQALFFTQNKLKRKGHISGKELLEGIRDLALEQFGPMAKTVLEHWGITSSEDFGDIVFNLIDNGLLFKTQEDSKDDFKNVYDFKEAFDSTKYKFDLKEI